MVRKRGFEPPWVYTGGTSSRPLLPIRVLPHQLCIPSVETTAFSPETANAVSFRLCMTIRTQKAKIGFSIVGGIAVHMVDLNPKRLSFPCVYSTLFATICSFATAHQPLQHSKRPKRNISSATKHITPWTLTPNRHCSNSVIPDILPRLKSWAFPLTCVIASAPQSCICAATWCRRQDLNLRPWAYQTLNGV